MMVQYKFMILEMENCYVKELISLEKEPKSIKRTKNKVFGKSFLLE